MFRFSADPGPPPDLHTQLVFLRAGLAGAGLVAQPDNSLETGILQENQSLVRNVEVSALRRDLRG